MAITTTLNRIRAHRPCTEGWTKLLKHLGKTWADDEPLPFAVILESNGINDALWCCRAEPQYAKEWRLYAVWCARQVQHLMADPRSLAALDVAERHANGQSTDDELDAARGFAGAAARAAWAAWAAQSAAGGPPWAAAGGFPWAAEAAEAAAGGSPWVAALAARAAGAAEAAEAAARAARAAGAAEAAQSSEFLRIVK